MTTGYIQLRRGILEHLADGRITSDEFAAYTVVLLAADRRSGSWKGSGAELAKRIGWQVRKAQRVLAELARKGYLALKRLGGRVFHGYLVSIPKYFPTLASPVTRDPRAGVTHDVRPPTLASPMTPPALQEVLLQEEKKQEAERPAAAPPRRAQNARQFKPFPREVREAKARAEARVGTGPSQGGDVDAKPKEGYLDFVQLRDKGRIPKGVTWTIWQTMTEDQRAAAIEKATNVKETAA